MTVAQKIASGEQKPTKGLLAIHENNVAIVKAQAEGLRSARGRKELTNRAHAEAVYALAARAGSEAKPPQAATVAASVLAEGYENEQGETVELTEAQAHQFSGLSNKDARAQADAFIAENLQNGLYAYGFEEQSDGSWVAVYVTGESEEPQFAAFEEWADTAAWHPVNAPQED